MSNIQFKNEKVKKLYEKVLHEHRFLAKIILNLANENGGCIKIEEIDGSEKGISFTINDNLDEVHTYIDIDLLKKKIYVKAGYRLYQEVYDDIPKNTLRPIGHLYQGIERTIFKRLSFSLDKDNKVKYYELNDKNNHYTIVIDIKNDSFDEDIFISKILYNVNRYNNIRDLFVVINEIVGTYDLDIKLADQKGSNIVLKDGQVVNYLEYYEEKDQYIKIYLENGEFYYEKIIKEPYQDNMTLYVKKIGEQNGKKER